ncbi:MAG: hypothetical protein KAR23_04405, partial [Candidatus Aenigmarchaeota archaeon]|nr:hypothetical protein [Candidatus Aenigmarchaeota archaeon]
DTILPQIQFVNPTWLDNKNISVNYTYINWTIIELNWNMTIFNWNGTNTTLTNSSVNETSLADGTYIYYVWTNDSATNFNQTETRTVTIDTQAPSVSLDSPTNKTYNISTIYFNATASDTVTNVGWCGYSLDGAAYKDLTNDAGNHYTDINTTMTEGQHYVTIQCNDTASNINTTDSVYFTIDTTFPLFSSHQISPDPPHEDESVQINVTITETNIDTVWLQFDNNTGSTNYTVTTSSGDEYYYTIDIGNYTAHDTINYTWWANDTISNLNSSLEQTFTVANQIPSVTAPALNSTIPYTNDTLSCNSGTFSDNDAEDSETLREYKWYDTGVEISGQTSQTLDLTLSGLDKGDTINCSIRVYDNYDYSDWVNSSNTATIQNSELTVLLTLPANSDYRRQTFNFTYEVNDQDGIGDIDYCELWKDNGTGWTLHNNNTDPQTTNNVSYTVATLPTEQIETVDWYVNCTDSSSFENTSSQRTV